jgi:geranylgeranyl diphosphate synthase type II
MHLIEDALKNKMYGSNPKELYEPISYFMSLGGKRMRPLFTLIGADLFDISPEKAMPVAMAVELFHNFTLVHDDIMDKAPLRRNKPTVHEKWNQNIAILSGDVMFVKAYQELCKSEPDKLPALMNLFNETAVLVCEGQQLDMNYETQLRVTIQQYLKMIELKTAVLLGASLQMGAIAAGANKHSADLLYNFGKHVGVAFQLQDDILDVYADAAKFGKQKGGDIISNKKTYLLLKALEMVESNRYMKEELEQWIHAPNFDAPAKVEAVTNIYNYFNIKELAQKEMKKHYNAGLKCLDELEANTTKKENLKSLAQSLMDREN